MPIFRLPPDPYIFPSPLCADPSGLLAVGGELNAPRLYTAYSHGIFPWYNDDEPVLWWFPNPRCVLFPRDLKISGSLSSVIRKEKFHVTFNEAFPSVIRNCRHVSRKGQSGTWINDDIESAYNELHRLGYAHSVEAWNDAELVGGLYGVALGKIFFGESMFSLEADASKVALAWLVSILQDRDFRLIDCQQDTPHLRALGATVIAAQEFHEYMRENQLECLRSGDQAVLD